MLKTVMQDKRLTLQAKAMYIYFFQQAQAAGSVIFMLNKTPKEIQKDLNIGEHMYYSHLSKLVECNYLKMERTRNEKKQYNGCQCTLLPCIERIESND